MKNTLLYVLKLSLILTIVMSNEKSNAQNSPGGISAEFNSLWLRADEIDTTDLSPVTSWRDKSAKNNDAIQNEPTNAPIIYKFSGINNNKPYVSFLGANDQLIILDKPNSKLDSTREMTYFFAIRPKNTASLTSNAIDASAIVSKRSDCSPTRANWGCSDYAYFFWNNSRLFTDIVSDNNRFATNSNFVTDNQATILGITFNGYQPANDRVKIYKNGALELTAANEANTFIPNSNSALVIGAMDSGSLNSFKALEADIYEIIMYNKMLNGAERKIAENYMSSRYNIAITDDYYSHDVFNSLNWFGEDVSGIGRFNSFDKNYSAKSNLLTINNPSNIDGITTADNGKYLLFGHNGADTDNWNNVFGGGSNLKVVNKKWRVEERNWQSMMLNQDVGTVSIAIDTFDLPLKPTGFSKFVLVVDNDFDFSNGNKIYELAYDNATGKYIANGVNVENGDIINIGVLKPTIEFELPVSSGNEFDNAFVKVILNYIAQSPVTIDFQTIDVGSATESNNYCVDPGYIIGPDCFECYFNSNAGDYKGTSGTLTILPNTSFSLIEIEIFDDICGSDANDVGEFFNIQISNPSAGISLGSITTHTYYINDDDDSRVIKFTTTNSTVAEAAGTLEIQVELNNSSPNNNTTIEYFVQGITATALTDYMQDSSLTGGLIFGSLTIPPNTLTGVIKIDIVDDLLYEFSETARVVLFNSTNGRLSSIEQEKNHTFEILDNDPKPEVSFTQSTISINEDHGILNVPVKLSSKAGVPINVSFEGSNNSAVISGAFADYAYNNGTSITINPGTIDTVFKLVIYDDSRIEATETITLKIKSTINADISIDSICTISIFDNDVIGITGPGGVGDSTVNVLWLAADKITGLTNGQQVANWSDISGNNFVASQSTNRPTYVSQVASMNNKPSISFSGSNNPLIVTDNVLLDNATEYSIFVAARPAPTTGSLGLLEKRTAAGSGVFNNSTSYYIFLQRIGPEDFRIGADFNSNSIRRTQLGPGMTSNPLIINATFDGTREPSNKIKIDLNNTTVNTAGSLPPNNLYKINNSTANLRIGSGTAAGGSHFNGNVSEVIMYRSALNAAQKIIVNNYLSSKYNIPIANDYFTFEADGFGNEVAGIGQVDSVNVHSAAKGKGIVTIAWPQDMQNNEWLFFGHDNGSLTDLEPIDVPANIEDRYARKWVVQEEGDVGDVTVSFDLNPYSNVDPRNLVLLRSNTPSFLNATIDTSNRVFDVINKVISFSGINFGSGEYFTIGQFSNTALPVTLTSFNALPTENEEVLVKWSTATEINADYFDVEKSIDGINYEFAGSVVASGNSSTNLNYAIVDDKPYKGTSYYRLKQVDFDGKFEYFGPASVYLRTVTANKSVKVYPNPVLAANSFNAELKGFDDNELIYISIYNLFGQEVLKTSLDCFNDCVLEINLDNIPSGNYYVEFMQFDNKIIQKLIKQ